MKDKATYAGISHCTYVDMDTIMNILEFEREDFVSRDPQGKRHLRRWWILLLLRRLLLLVEMAAGPSPPLPPPAGTPLRPHRAG